VARAGLIGIPGAESELLHQHYPAWIRAKQARIIGISLSFLFYH